MEVLHTELRKLLETTVLKAREAAEKAASAALIALAVHQEDAYPSLSEVDKSLRRKLRAEARRLGDGLEKADKIEKGRDPFPALAAEVAYAQWHRLLFARFLAENNLLIHPEAQASVSLQDCAEIANEENKPNTDAWTVASEYAAAMLPGIFRNDDPILQLRFDAAGRLALESLLLKLPPEVFLANDSLGWVYQFWQAKQKALVNKSGRKIGGADIAPVTQLFTEHYMVQFLLHNSLGAWWAARHVGEPLPTSLSYLRRAAPKSIPEPPLLSTSGEEPRNERVSNPSPLPTSGEEAQRKSASEPPLLFLGEGAGGEGLPTFPTWPSRAADIKVLDPCCGSGHFLVAAFALLHRFRMAEEGLSEADAGDAVLRDNLFGLELDPRCTQIAAFAVCMAAWKAGGYRPLPRPNIACCGLAVGDRMYDWTRLAEKEEDPHERDALEATLGRLWHLFRNAPDLGSLIDPSRVAAEDHMFAVEWDKIAPLLERALAKEREQDDPAAIFGEAARGVLRAAELLTQKYTLVVTNVPYLGRGNQGDILREYIEKFHKAAKADLATAFVERCLSFCAEGGATALVTPQNWLFLGSYKSMREYLLKFVTWNVVAKLGPQAFSTPMYDYNIGMFILTNAAPAPSHALMGLDASAPRVPAEKAELLRCGPLHSVSQAAQLKNPDARIALEEHIGGTLLENYARAYKGVTSGDDPHYRRNFWEMPYSSEGWKYLQSTVNDTMHYNGYEHAQWFAAMRESLNEAEVTSEYDYGDFIGRRNLQNVAGVYIRAIETWGHRGVAVSQMRHLPCAISVGEPFDTNTAVVMPRDSAHLPAVWAFCSSPQFNTAVRRIDQALKVTNASLVKVPFDLEHWQQVAAEQYSHGLPEPSSDDPTQWLFHGRPFPSPSPSPARSFLARRGEQEGEGSESGSGSGSGSEGHSDKGSTAKEFMPVGNGVREPLQVAMGRLLGYRWPEHGLPPTASGKMRQEEDGLDAFADEDGILCLPAVTNEANGAQRLLTLLAAAYGPAWSPAVQEDLLAKAGFGGKGLEVWLREGFFKQHCALFHNRPFLWHIWDGERDGFGAIVNYHKLDRKNLDSLIYTYLGDWIARQRSDDNNGVAGAGRLLKAALDLQVKLKAIAHGESAPDGKSGYDIYVRWKLLHQQPIGWEPDLNDGVRLNIRPFVTAGILRCKFTINWNTDRGNDPKPNLSGTTDRHNDLHLTRAQKEQARRNPPPATATPLTKPPETLEL